MPELLKADLRSSSSDYPTPLILLFFVVGAALGALIMWAVMKPQTCQIYYSYNETHSVSGITRGLRYIGGVNMDDPQDGPINSTSYWRPKPVYGFETKFRTSADLNKSLFHDPITFWEINHD